VIYGVRRQDFWAIASLCDAFQVPKPLSPQLQPFGKSDDDLGELTFGVERFLLCPHLADGPRGPGGRSARTWRTVRAARVRSVFFVFLLVFRFDLSRFWFWVGRSFGRSAVEGGRSAGAWRTVRVLPADGPWFPAGRSARLIADGPPCLAGRSARGCALCFFGSIPLLLLSCFRVCFKESFLRLEVDP
jgi:hypothetical protein